MDRENKAVKVCSCSPQKTQQNVILSFLAPRTGWLWPRSYWINYPGRAMQSRLFCSLPPLQTLLPSPDQLPPTALYRHLSSRSATGAVINGCWTGRLLARAEYVPLLQVMCSWYMCFCAEVFFFLFSHCTIQWSIVWGLNFFFFFFSSCKCCIFLTFPVFLFCLPRCHMYVVYVWTG